MGQLRMKVRMKVRMKLSLEHVAQSEHESECGLEGESDSLRNAVWRVASAFLEHCL